MDYGCKHYKRKCKLVAPCCNQEFPCRFCHNDATNHEIDRKSVSHVSCSECQLVQAVAAACTQCGVEFGKYFCSICKLFDEDKQQFHCDGCGICRVGGRENFFHCSKCGLCLPNSTEQSHKCIERSSHTNCPVCMDDIHTSRTPAHIPKCGHLIHQPCFEAMVSAGHYACPLCGESTLKMDEAWKSMDELVAATPMPEEYQNVTVGILCKDCHKESTVKFHILDLKCSECGSYNTSRIKGPFNLPESAQNDSISSHTLIVSLFGLGCLLWYAYKYIKFPPIPLL